MRSRMALEPMAVMASFGEHGTLKFMETTGTRQEAAKAVCAFPNRGGGQVMFGVTPTGTVIGQQVAALQHRGTEHRACQS